MAPVELFATDGEFKSKSGILPGASWIPCSYSEYPRSAVAAGIEGTTLNLVARSTLKGRDGGLVPGRLVSHGYAYLPQEDREVSTPFYEILVAKVGSLIWAISMDGNILENAVLGGKAVNGELLFIGRVRHAGTWVPGKVVPSLNKCIVSWDGKTWEFSTYELLVGVDPRLPEGSKIAHMSPHSSHSAPNLWAELAYQHDHKQSHEVAPIPNSQKSSLGEPVEQMVLPHQIGTTRRKSTDPTGKPKFDVNLVKVKQSLKILNKELTHTERPIKLSNF